MSELRGIEKLMSEDAERFGVDFVRDYRPQRREPERERVPIFERPTPDDFD